MGSQLRLLILEDRARDAELMIEQLRLSGFELDWTRVQTQQDFLTEIQKQPDIILADYNLPQFSGLEAVRMLKQQSLDIPLIVVSGTVGEDRAVECIKEGAADYLLKDRLVRLGEAIKRAMAEKLMRQSQQQATEALAFMAAVVESSDDAIIGETLDGIILSWNSGAEKLYGYSRLEAIGQPITMIAAPERHQEIREILQKLKTGEAIRHFETVRVAKDGHLIDVSLTLSPILGSDGVPKAASIVVRDITARKRSEKALIESEERFRRLTENAPDVIYRWRIDPPGMEYLSPAVKAVSGYSPEEFASNPNLLMSIAHPDDKAILHGMLTGLSPFKLQEARIIHKEGHVVWIERRSSPVYDADGTLIATEGIVRDITESKKAEENLRYHADLLDQLSDAVISTDLDFNIRSWNSAAERIYGWSAEEAVGKKMRTLINTQYLTESQEEVVNRFLTDGQWNGEVIQQRKDRSSVPILSSVIMVRDSTGKPNGVVAVNRDITEHKRAEEAVYEAERFATSTINALSDNLCVLDENGAVLTVNRSWREFAETNLPLIPEYAVGSNYLAICDEATGLEEADAKKFAAGLRAVMSGKASDFMFEYACHQLNGEQRWFVATVTRFVGEGPLRIVVTHRNITERKQAEAAEQEQRKLAEALRDVAATLTSTLDLNKVLTRILDTVGQVLPHDAKTIMLAENGVARVVSHAGYDERGLGKEVSQVSHVIADTLNLAYMAESGHSLCIPNTDDYIGWYEKGATNWIRSSIGAPIRVGGKVLGFINLDSATPHFFNNDQAARLQAFADQAAVAVKNAQLYQELDTYSGILEQAVAERTAQLQATTHRAETILNSVGEALLVLGLDGDIQQSNPAFEQQTGYTATEAQGQSHHDLLKLQFGSKGDYQMILESLRPGERWHNQTKVTRKDGTTYDADLTIAPVFDNSGQKYLLVAVIRDITPLKEVERAKDEFVSNVSHELRTPITGIKLNYSMLSFNPERREVYMERIGREIDRLNELIEDLLRLTRLEQGRVELNLEPVDLNVIGSQLVHDRRPIAETRNLLLVFEEMPDLASINADAGLLGQALSVLITNAMNYTPSDGQITISALQDSNSDRRRVGLSVADTGPGILQSEQPKLFERFYRGSAGRASGAPGTGLGLNIAQQIVGRHGGTLELFSEGIPGKGSIFTIWIPVEN